MGGGLGGVGASAQQQQEQMRLMEMMQEMQVTDSLRMYNELVLRCFGQCVDSFRSRKLDGKEVSLHLLFSALHSSLSVFLTMCTPHGRDESNATTCCSFGLHAALLD